jgi:DNA mismatch endonuclease (patch repair protein)
MSDTLSKEKRSQLMAKVRDKNTRPELLVRKWLHRNGYRFRLYRKDLPGKPDIVLPKYKTVIFIHGCFWHRHLKCTDASIPSANQEFWIDKFSSTIRRDSRVLRELHTLGWKTMVILECQLEKDTVATINRVANWLSLGKITSDLSLGNERAINRQTLIRTAAKRVRSRTRRYGTNVLPASFSSLP